MSAEDVPERVDHLLVLGPGTGTDRRRRALETVSPEMLEGAVVEVTYTQSVHDVMADWSERAGSRTLDLNVVRVQERATGDAYDDIPEAVTVVTANPNDLTGLAMRLQDQINRARRAGGGVMYFESVTFLLQYHDVQSVFKFLHMLTGQLRDAGLVGLFGADPTAVDEQTLARVRTVLDDVVEVDVEDSTRVDAE